MAKGSFGTLTVIFLKENGSTTERRDMEYILMQMERVMKGFGKKIYSMGKAKSSGLMAVSISETTNLGKSMDRENTGGQIIVIMMEIGAIIKLKVKGHTSGLTDEGIPVDGKIMTWKDMEHTGGQMVANTKGLTIMIKNMALLLIHGLMAGSMKVTGLRASSMGKENILLLKEILK